VGIGGLLLLLLLLLFLLNSILNVGSPSLLLKRLLRLRIIVLPIVVVDTSAIVSLAEFGGNDANAHVLNLAIAHIPEGP
jgi:hypothetical protein